MYQEVVYRVITPINNMSKRYRNSTKMNRSMPRAQHFSKLEQTILKNKLKLEEIMQFGLWKLRQL